MTTKNVERLRSHEQSSGWMVREPETAAQPNSSNY